MSSAAGAVGGLAGSIIGNAWSSYGAHRAGNKTTRNYKSRYQDTMADMKKSGLNPILASSGGFNVGQSGNIPAPQIHDMSQAMSTSAKQFAQAKTEESKQDNIKQDTKLKIKQVKTEIEKATNLRASTGKITQEEKNLAKTIPNIMAQLQLLKQQKKLSKRQTAIAENNVNILSAQLKRLNKIAEVYKTPTGTGFAWIEAFVKSLGGIFRGNATLHTGAN